MFGRAVWDVRPADAQRADALATACGVEPLIGQLFLNRGITEPAEAQRFLAPELARLGDPLRLPDMPRAASRIHRAIRARELIVVFGDSDVDGVTASAIVYEVLTSLARPGSGPSRRAGGARVEVRVSNRLADGYGFPHTLVARLARAKVGLVILVDCGTNQPEEIRALARQGIETIVLDHHVPSEFVAEPLALVNPYRGDGAGQGLCSAGLAMKLAQALCPDDGEDLSRFLDLAALGTLADYAPLLGDNRILVSVGLARLLDTSRPGLRRLCEAVRVTQPSPEQILQRLVPRLNASGRLGEAGPVWQLLVEPSATTAERLATRLGDAHATTKSLARQIHAEAFEQVNRLHFKHELVMVLGRRGWHPGLMGPLASQLMERYARPTIAIAFEEHLGVGSGRSPSGFNLFEALRACQGMLVRYGGHPQACGLTIRAERLEQFREDINRHAETALGRRSLVRSLVMDAQVTLADVTPRLAETLARFAPFGPGNPRPLMLIRNVTVDTSDVTPTWLTDGVSRVKLRGRPGGLVPTERYDVVVTLGLAGNEAALSVCDARLSTTRRTGLMTSHMVTRPTAL